MGSHKKSRLWRVCRVTFRRFRISVWMLVLTVLAAVVYLNQVGLPDVVKGPLLQKLREQGLDLQFSRLRLSWHEGIVAENVHFGSADQEFAPHLNVGEVRVLLNWERLAHRQVQVDSLMLRHGRVTWAFADTNQARRELSVTNIQTDLRFLPGDKWSLDNFRAQFAGARIQLSGVVTNASSVRDWKIFQGQEPASRSAALWENRLQHLADTLNSIHFSAPPELRVLVRGDALDLHTFNVLLSLSAPGAQTPWGTATQGRFAARLFSVDSNGLSRAEIDLHTAEAQTPWGAVTNCSINLDLASGGGESNLVRGKLKISARQVHTQWANATNAVFNASWTHAITNPIPIVGQSDFSCDYAQTPWASASNVQLRGNLAQTTDHIAPSDAALAYWTNLWPYRLSWDCRMVDLVAAPIRAERLACAGDWLTPELTVTNLDAIVSGGHLSAKASLDTVTRIAHLTLSSDCDAHVLASYFSENASRWMSQFYWPQPPRLEADLSATLPSWTNREPNWRAELLPGALLTGQLEFPQGGGFRQLQISSAKTHFVYSNQCWYLPDFTVVRPEGRLTLEQRYEEQTDRFYARMSSTLDPSIVRPFLDASAQEAFDLITLSNPPAIKLQVWGIGKDPAKLLARGSASLSDFTFRGEQFSSLDTEFEYTNQMIRFFAPRVEIGKTHLEADGLAVDLNAQFVYLTNGFSTADPMVVARAIGPQVARDIVDYQFRSPPTARVHGAIPLQGEEGADLYFDLTGGPFHWWKLNLPHITGQVHWAGLHLSLTNMQAEFYNGVAVGAASFDFPRNRPAEFQFNFSGTNVLLQSLMTDLSPGTNQPEGRFSASLAVTKANVDDWQSVFGFGEAHLHDGMLWDIPLFGIFSPVLNGISPGLGNNRASAAGASFVITNGVVRTGDLEIRSTGMRLLYRGTVNLDGQLSARVDAELLRDMWLVGPLVSTVFWPVTKLFEYKVNGTLADPRSQPVFILPKLMLLPFHPFRTLKGLRPEDPNSNPNFSPLPP